MSWKGRSLDDEVKRPGMMRPCSPSAERPYLYREGHTKMGLASASQREQVSCVNSKKCVVICLLANKRWQHQVIIIVHNRCQK